MRLAYGFILLLPACLTDVELEESDQAVASANRLASNRLASNRLASNRLASNKLSLSALPGNTPLIDSDDGREVLGFVIGCALPAGQVTNVVASSGTTYSFPGMIGLAPAWADRVPTQSERRWVTACVLARTNLYGAPVQISLRGGHPALATTAAELQHYATIDGGFYGDLFDPNEQTWFACDGSSGVENDPTNHSLRACADTNDGVTTLCGFTATGHCPSVCAGPTPPFTRCPGDGQTWSEVITAAFAN
jgi:hypothetical protein